MLIEVKTKISWILENKIVKKINTYVLDKEFFANTEYTVHAVLQALQNENQIKDFEILSLKKSDLKEIYLQYEGTSAYIANLKDTFIDDDGNEKTTKYKVLFWASNMQNAVSTLDDIVAQGYNMQIENLKEVNYTYIPEENESPEN